MLLDPSQPLAGSPTILRPARALDGPGMWQLATDTGLDVNSPYAYALWGQHHARTTLVAERDGALVGFVLGYLVPMSRRDLFVWQVGVDRAQRATGIASLMLDTLCRSLQPGALEATVTPSNTASDRLFRSFARRHGAPVTTSPCFGPEHLAGDHEQEELYRIELSAASAPPDHPTARGETIRGAV